MQHTEIATTIQQCNRAGWQRGRSRCPLSHGFAAAAAGARDPRALRYAGIVNGPAGAHPVARPTPVFLGLSDACAERLPVPLPAPTRLLPAPFPAVQKGLAASSHQQHSTPRRQRRWRPVHASSWRSSSSSTRSPRWRRWSRRCLTAGAGCCSRCAPAAGQAGAQVQRARRGWRVAWHGARSAARIPVASPYAF